jgi:hypothetical protein
MDLFGSELVEKIWEQDGIYAYQGSIVKYYVRLSGNTVPLVAGKAKSFLVQVTSKHF